jgi:hypothetical protein
MLKLLTEDEIAIVSGGEGETLPTFNPSVSISSDGGTLSISADADVGGLDGVANINFSLPGGDLSSVSLALTSGGTTFFSSYDFSSSMIGQTITTDLGSGWTGSVMAQRGSDNISIVFTVTFRP